MRANEHEKIRGRIITHFNGNKDAAVDFLIFYACLVNEEADTLSEIIRDGPIRGYERNIKPLIDAVEDF